MARRVTLTYVVTVADGDDDECVHDAETELFQALEEKVEAFEAAGIERTITLDPSSRPTVSGDA
jgi:hypothetical protein